MGRAWHQAGSGEVRVGQKLRFLVHGEGALLVGRLQVASWDPRVGVPHAPPDGVARMGAPHAAAGWLIHGNAEGLHSILRVLLELKASSESKLKLETCIFFLFAYI